MMVVLLNTNFTYLAMVASSRFLLHAFEADFLGLVDVKGDVLFLFRLLGEQQRYV